MAELKCPVCHLPFVQKKVGHTYCKKLCRERANPPLRGRCPVCSKRFGEATGKHKPYCSDVCEETGCERKRGGLALGNKAKKCQHCKVLVPRRSVKGPWPSVCIGCLPAHRRLIAARWMAANPERCRSIHRKHRAYKRTLRKSFGDVTRLKGIEDFAPNNAKFAPHEKASTTFDDDQLATISDQKVGFIIDLFEICHQALMSGSTSGCLAVVSRRVWVSSIYATGGVTKASTDRGWERFKAKIRKLGLSAGELVDEETTAISLLFDPEFIRHATDKALGIDDSLTLE